jgi:hypothetical protein
MIRSPMQAQIHQAYTVTYRSFCPTANPPVKVKDKVEMKANHKRKLTISMVSMGSNRSPKTL